MRPQRLRKRIEKLDRDRRTILHKLMHPEEMVAGSVYEVHKKCGNPNCRCARGRKHGPFACLSVTKSGRRKLIFVRREDEPWVKVQAAKYREYQKMMARVRKMNDTILELLKQLRDSMLKDYS